MSQLFAKASRGGERGTKSTLSSRHFGGMNALRMGLDVAVDTMREVASKYEDNGPSTSGYGVGPPSSHGPSKIESGAYSSGRMQGFGRDGDRHQMEAPSDSAAHREREVDRTATGAP